MSLTREQLEWIVDRHKEMVSFSRQKDRARCAALAELIENFLSPLVSDTGVVSDTGEEQDTFAAFFKQIGDGMLETQQELDRRSSQYLESIKGRPHLLASVFRIPEVTGKLKVGLSQEKDKKLNFIVFGNATKSKNWVEHEIDFKLNAVPPPPDALRELDELPAALSLVLNSGERLSIFEAIAVCLDEGRPEGEFDPGPYPQNAHAQAQRALTKDSKASNKTLIWIDGNGGVLLVAGYEQANGAPLHGAWRLELSHTRPAPQAPHRLTPVWRASKSQREREYTAVDAYLRSAYDAQRRLLENLPPAVQNG